MRLILRDKQEVKEDSGRGFTAVQGMEENSIKPVSPVYNAGDRQQDKGRPSFEDFMSRALKDITNSKKPVDIDKAKKRIAELEDEIPNYRIRADWDSLNKAQEEMQKLKALLQKPAQ